MAIVIEKRTNLDAPIKVDSLNGVMFTTEAEAHQFIVRCEQEGQELTLAGTVSAKLVRGDGNTVELIGSISDGAAVVTLSQDCYNVQGRFQLAMFNQVGDAKLCIYACVGYIQKAQSGDLIDGGGIIPDVEDLIADIQAAVESIPPSYTTLLASVAGTYSASNTYSVGDYAWYNGTLYRCSTAISTAEAWTAAHWTAAVLGDDLSVIKSAFESMESAIGETPMGTTAITVTGAIAEHQGDIETITDSIGAETTRATAAEALKVNKPTTNPDGTSGQVLRTLGNGQTEWASVASPTDAQVETAVTDWLDAHPEATTTVEDFSLTANKLVKGTLGYVIPQQFGAKGDGETDDTQALKDCIAYAQANNYAVYIPMGTYIVTGGLSFTITDGQSIIIIGDGQNTLIKRKDVSLSGKWSQIFSFTISPVSAHANDVILSNFCIDSNRRGQGGIPADSYAYEASADISIRGSGSGTLANDLYLDRFVVDNMRFYDPVADCVNVSGSAQIGVRDVFINRIVATGRNGTRNDIGFTGNPLHAVFITGCDVGSIHFEYNSTPDDDLVIPYLISNCVFGACSLGAKIDLEMHDVICQDGFLINSFRTARINNCTLYCGFMPYTVFANGDATFADCHFITNITDTSSHSVYLRGASRVEFNHCRFSNGTSDLYLDADDDGINDHYNYSPVIGIENNVSFPVIIDNCEFDEHYYAAANCNANNVTLKNMLINTACPCTVQKLNNSGGSVITYENIELGDKCLFTIGSGLIHDSGTRLTLTGDLIATPNNYRMFGPATNVSSYINRMSGRFNRIVYIDEPLTYSLIKQTAGNGGNTLFVYAGDTYIYAGDDRNRYPNKWVFNKKGIYAASNDGIYDGKSVAYLMTAYGSGHGTIQDRPTCLLPPGFEYFDETLGYKVIWDGTQWTNSDGTAALSVKTASGRQPCINTDVAMPYESIAVSIMPTQSGSGTPSPSNVRQLGGRTGVAVTRRGKNLSPVGTGTELVAYGVTDNYNYKCPISGLDPDINYVMQVTVTAPVEGDKRLYLDGINSSGYISLATDTAPKTFKIYRKPSADGTMQIRGSKAAFNDATFAATVIDIQVTAGTEITTFEAYQTPSTLANIDWTTEAGTVFGGYIDVVSGKLYAVPYYASYNGETLVGPWVSSMDVYDPENPGALPTIGAQVVDLGGELTEYSLQRQEITAIIGVNNLSNDIMGDMTVKYYSH